LKGRLQLEKIIRSLKLHEMIDLSWPAI